VVFCPKCAVARPTGPIIRGQRLCVPCGDEDALYWKACTKSARAAQLESEDSAMRAWVELDDLKSEMRALKKTHEARERFLLKALSMGTPPTSVLACSGLTELKDED
jgi:hypothetical protein